MANIIFRNQRISANFDKLHTYIAMRSRYLHDRRTRFEVIDRELERENDRDSRSRDLIRKNFHGDKTKLRDMTAPVIGPAYEAALAHMDGVFLSGFPIFSVVANRENENHASAMHALMGRDQQYFGWERQLRKAVAQALRYNEMGLAVHWTEEVASRVITENTVGSPNSGKVEEFQYKGNKIAALDMYNTFRDMSVDAGDVATDGDFAGWIERKTYAQLKAYLQTLSNDFKNTAILKEVFATPANHGSPLVNSQDSGRLSYFEPEIRIDIESSDPQDFRTFFDTAHTRDGAGNVGGMYDLVVAYVRIIPKDFGIIAPRAGSVHIFRVEWVNGRCVYVQPFTDGHGRFPLVFANLMDDGLKESRKSFCENLIDFQDIATALSRARFKSLRRAISDRALFDPQRIREQDVNSENASAKIPVRMNALNRDLSSAYFPIPYRDEFGATFNAEFGQQLQLADRASGINQAMAGNFTKGNRTFQEFDRVMTGGEKKLEMKAKMLEGQAFTQVKHIIRSNYLQYAVAEKLFDRNTRKPVEVDPVALRQQEINFTITDGLLPASKVMNPELVNTAVTGLTQIGAMTGQAPQYDVVGMLVSVLKSAGFHNLEDYKLEQPNAAANPQTSGGAPPQPNAPAA